MKKTRILPMPKIAFFYPLIITSFVCSLMPEQNKLTALIFFFVFTLNLLVLVIDFSDFKSLMLVAMILFFGYALFFANDYYAFLVERISSDPQAQKMVGFIVLWAMIMPLISLENWLIGVIGGCFFAISHAIIFLLQTGIKTNIYASSSFFYVVGVVLTLVTMITISYNFLCKSWIWTWNENKICSCNIFGKIVTYKDGGLQINCTKGCTLKHLLLGTGSVLFYIPSQNKSIVLYDAYLNKRYID
ncbi:hypothetical protein [Candidatus Uabimicrobium sp. HlEnr_7]|uniref:hypothetical protein n=1 Tax=Candidatus Uabimicrobium helgolandensis TaxID=3095367 RepID=UPI0035592D80